MSRKHLCVLCIYVSRVYVSSTVNCTHYYYTIRQYCTRLTHIRTVTDRPSAVKEDISIPENKSKTIISFFEREKIRMHRYMYNIVTEVFQAIAGNWAFIFGRLGVYIGLCPFHSIRPSRVRVSAWGLSTGCSEGRPITL